ncbi:MAG: arylsulfotransferase family protein [Solirubrobacteraceae bacterium]
MKASRTALALLSAGAATTALAAGCSNGSHKTASAPEPSPACLPSALHHDAKLAGVSAFVSPAPGSVTANPYTQISVLGVPAAQIRQMSVTGARSGAHAGRLRAYSQGDGASFLPSTPFADGEQVSVRATIAGKRVSYGFQVDTPYPTASVKPFPNPAAAPGEEQGFATLPGAKPPVLTVTAADRDPSAGDVFLTNGPGPGHYGPMIFTPQGRLVWFDQLSGGRTAENLSVQDYERQPHLTFWQGKVLSLGFGQGEDVVMNPHYQVVARVPGGNGLQADLHDFQIAPHGVSYSTAFNPIRCDLSSVGGARGGAIVDTAVQAIDMHTGLVRWEWHSLDHVAAQESETEPPKAARPWDWFHLNSIDVEPDGDLLLSARSTWATYQLQRGTGEVLWRLGGNKSSFKMGPGTETAWQHDARLLPNGEVTLFDDGSNPPIHHQSRAVTIALDFAAHTATLRSSLTHPTHLLSVSQGNMQTLPSGNTVVGYGSIPEISEFASDGSLLFDAHLPLDMVSYRAFRFPWSAQPPTPPAVLGSLNNTSEETIVHMSWNGATDVASWRVLAGASPNSLSVRTTVAVSGFESVTILPEKSAYVQAQALDSSGRVLASSHPARVVSYAAALGGAGAQ